MSIPLLKTRFSRNLCKYRLRSLPGSDQEFLWAKGLSMGELAA